MSPSDHDSDEQLALHWLIDADFIRSYYQRRLLRAGGVTPAALDWRTAAEHRQLLHYALSHIDWASVKSVFDVGCGDARCAVLLAEMKGGPIDYSGVDLVPEFILSGRQVHPDLDIRIGNFVDPSYLPPHRYDLVINLGGLNSRVSEPIKHLETCLRKMLRISGRYVAFNLIVDPEPEYFPNGNQHTIGHIGYYVSHDVLGLLREISRGTGWSHQADRKSIFRGSDDLFVTFHDDTA